MRMRTISLWSAALFSGAMITCAQQPRPGNPGSGGHEGPEMGGVLGRILEQPGLAKKIGITEEEATRIKDSMYETGKKNIQLRADRQLAELELRKLLDMDAPDLATIDKALEEAGRLQTELRKQKVHQRVAVREILGPEKAAKLKKAMQRQLRQQAKQRRGRSGDPGQGDESRKDSRPRRSQRVDDGPQGRGDGPPWMRDAMPPPEKTE